MIFTRSYQCVSLVQGDLHRRHSKFTSIVVKRHTIHCDRIYCSRVHTDCQPVLSGSVSTISLAVCRATSVNCIACWEFTGAVRECSGLHRIPQCNKTLLALIGLNFFFCLMVDTFSVRALGIGISSTAHTGCTDVPSITLGSLWGVYFLFARGTAILSTVVVGVWVGGRASIGLNHNFFFFFLTLSSCDS